MSTCSSCGGHSCTCNNYGCIGNLVMILCTGVGIVLMFGIALFMLPGIAVYFIGGELDGGGQEYMRAAMKDHRLWVVSSVFWVGSGIAFFWWKTSIPNDEPKALLERDAKGRFVSTARRTNTERNR